MQTLPQPKFGVSDVSVTMDANGYGRRRFTVSECEFLQENGLLTAGQYELIEGDIVFKMGQADSHIIAVMLTIRQLIKIFDGAAMRTQANIGIGRFDPDNEPEPDVAVLRGSDRDYKSRKVEPSEDVLLAVEVAATSLVGDTTVKTRIYGQQGVREYWVLDVENRVLHVFRDPTATGYASHVALSDTDTVSPLAALTASVCVSDLLP